MASSALSTPDKHRRRRLQTILLILLLLVAAATRLHGLFANSFHPDEALFAAWARLIAVGRDPLLQTQAVDKPPLLFYLQASLYPLLGTPAPWVARLPGLAASMLLVALSGRIVMNLYDDRLAALAAVAMVALSPLAIQFSATAFTDVLLIFWLWASATLISESSVRRERGSAAAAGPSGSLPASGARLGARLLLQIGRNHVFLGGLAFGLAAATKYQAWLFLPLLLALGWMRGWRLPQWKRWGLGMGLVLVALLLWQAARGGPWLWQEQLGNYGGLRLLWSWELWPRLEAWGRLWGTLLGSPVLAFAVVLALPLFLALLINDQDWPTAYDQLFLLILIGYSFVHWFVAVPIWDRYLLPMLPPAALLLGRFLSRVLAFLRPELPFSLAQRYLPAGALLALVLLLLPPALQARQGEFPVGGRPDADGGAATVAAVLVDAPYGTVLYDHWFGWQWRYYLFDSGVHVSHFAGPADLAADLSVFGGEPGARYVALPPDDRALPVRRAVEEAGYRLQPVRAAPEMVLYRVEQP